MKKLKAFTILEMVVTMIISSIVIGIVYTSYDFIGKQFITYKMVNEEITESLTLNYLINKDIIEAEHIIKTANGINIASKEENKLNYAFETQQVIREINNIQDTFFIPIFNVETRLLNKEQIFMGGLIDELVLTTKITGEEQRLHFSKQYGADVLIGLDNN